MINKKTTFNRGCLRHRVQKLAVIALLAFSQAPQANAMVMDSQVFGQYQASRTLLLNKERSMQQDCDDLQRQIDDLNRKQDRDLQGQINDLCRSLDTKFSDLRRIRQQLRDVEMKML